MAEREREARAQLRERLLGAPQPLRGMHQPLGAAIQRLRGVLQAPAHLAREAAHAVDDARGELGARRRGELGRGRRRGRAPVGSEVGDSEVGLVPDADHDRDARSADRARHALLVEAPQVLDRAAAAHEEQHIAFGARIGLREHRGDAAGSAFALHRRGIDDHGDGRVAPGERGKHIA